MSQVVKLPPPPGNDITLHRAIENRRSRRAFAEGEVSFEQASELLWSTAGVTDAASGHRAAPSAGATYPIDAYLVVERVEGLSAGIYKYNSADHSLSLLREGHFTEALAEAALGQGSLKTAACVICLFAVVERTSARYGDRAERYVDMEIGHIGQNIYLAAEGLGLSTVAIGAFKDDAVSALFAVPGVPRYFLPIGLRK